MQNTLPQNKEFKHVWHNDYDFPRRMNGRMQKPRSINELLRAGGRRLGALKARADDRNVALEHVCRALPARLAETVVSAGLEHGRLTIGVAGGSWAARLRYATDTLRSRVGSSMGVDIQSVRIKVVPPRA
jgi:hypothetical protein